MTIKTVGSTPSGILPVLFQALCEIRKAECLGTERDSCPCSDLLMQDELAFLQGRVMEELHYHMSYCELGPLWKSWLNICEYARTKEA